MMQNEQLRRRLKLLCKLFFIGLLLQFFVQTFITYKLERTGGFWSAVRMWKEFLMFLLGGIVVFSFLRNLPIYRQVREKEGCSIFRIRSWLTIFHHYHLSGFFLLLGSSVLIFLIIGFLLQQTSFNALLLSFKYDLMPFFIFGIGVGLGLLYFTEKDTVLLRLYQKILLWGIIFGLLWWMCLCVVPTGLQHFGYSPYAVEGSIGSAPPVAYYTNIYAFYENSYTRNAFLFERPIYFGFWLIAFFPFFFLSFAKKEPKRFQIFSLLACGALVFSTRSRAALLIRFFEIIVLYTLLYKDFIKKHLLTICIVGGSLLLGVGFFGRSYFLRYHSTTGHIMLLKEGLNFIKKAPLFGRGIGYAGPASHQICYTDISEDEWDYFEGIGMRPIRSQPHTDPKCEEIRQVNSQYSINTQGFNSENQFVQILMEYGIVGFLFWIACLLRILGYSFHLFKKYSHRKLTTYQKLLYFSILGLGLGLFGLCAEGMVLHSFADKMVVYPFFFLYGITIGLREQEREKLSYQELPNKGPKKNLTFQKVQS